MLEAASDPRLQILIFEVGGLHGAVLLGTVHRLERAVKITRLPGAPPAIEGIFDLHGTLVPVVDVRERLNLPPASPDINEHFIVLTAGDGHIAIRVNAITDIEEIDGLAVEDMQNCTPHAQHLIGVARMSTGLVLIHDPELFLSPSESLQLSSALTSARGAR